MSLSWTGLLGLASDGGTTWLPVQASTGAVDHDALFYFIYYTCVVFFVGVVGTMFYFVIKYRRRSADQRTSPVRGNFRLEVAWAVLPSILLLVMFVWGFKGFLASAVPPANAMEVRVHGQRWSWSFQYPQGFENDDLVVPVNTPVRLTMTSSDVIHSFFVPAFRIKRDVLPRRYTVLWFQATQIGTFQVFCAEYCGDQHSNMLSHVNVVSQDDFDEFIRNAGGSPNQTPAQHGERIFHVRGCIACHNTAPDLSGPHIGPSLWNAYGREEHMNDGSVVTIDDDYIRQSMLDPQAKIVQGFPDPSPMPSQQGQVNDEQISAVIDYIKSLHDGGTQ
jgi:cytochrome c oxidase subunit 2